MGAQYLTTPHCQEFATMMMKLAAALLLLSSLVSGQAEQPKDLLCDICVDIVTDLDEWITSDSTMDDIIKVVVRKRRKRRRKRKLLQQPTLLQREEMREARRKRLPSKWNPLDRFLFIFFEPLYKYRCKHGLY